MNRGPSGAVTGGLSGGINAAVNGGDILEGVLIGAAVGGVVSGAIEALRPTPTVPTDQISTDDNSTTPPDSVTTAENGQLAPMSPPLLQPGMEVDLDRMMMNPKQVDALGTLYGLDQKYGVTSGGYREFNLTLYNDVPVVGSLTSGARVPFGSTFVESVQDIDTSRLGSFFSINHSHPQGHAPSWTGDFASQTVVSRLGGWSIVVTSKRIYFTGPKQSQYYFRPTSDFIDAGRATGRTIPIPAEPPEYSKPF